MFPLRDTVPSKRPPLVVLLLIALNLLVFVREFQLDEDGLAALFTRFALVPSETPLALDAFLAAPERYLTYASSMFLHGGILHLVGNLWSLWIFGDNVEDRLGHLAFLVFYLVCGLLAGATHAWFQPDSSVPTIGASGAISGVMGAYLFLFPRARVVTLVPVFFFPLFVELRAYLFLGLWFSAQLVSGWLSLRETEAATGIAFLAHVGGSWREPCCTSSSAAASPFEARNPHPGGSNAAQPLPVVAGEDVPALESRTPRKGPP